MNPCCRCHLLAAMRFTGQILPKLLLLTAAFTALLLLMRQGLGGAPSRSSTAPGSWEAWHDAIYTVPRTFKEERLIADGMPCRELSNGFPDLIVPPLVHWTTKDGRVHKKLISIVQSWLALLNRGNGSDANSFARWRFMHWDDVQILNLIEKHYPRLNSSYYKLTNGLERSDIGRLVVLHHVGGLYVDLDVELKRDVTPLLTRHREDASDNSSACRTALWSQEPLEHAEFIFDRRWMISNAVMMSRANHSFLNYVLSAWPAWFEANWAKKRRAHGDAVFVTGPIMLQAFYDKYAALGKNQRPEDWCDGLIAEPEAFQPVMDAGFIKAWLKKKCVNIQKLPERKQMYCRHAICDNFQNRQVPNSSYTVHHFMHLSYQQDVKLDDSKCILKLVPIFTCKI